MINIKNMEDKLLSTQQAGDIMGISRIAVYNQVKKGQLPSIRLGKNYYIRENDLTSGCLTSSISKKEEQKIDKAVSKVIKDYGETLRLLGNV